MALMQSNMLALGTKAPGFSLKTPDGSSISLSDYDGANAVVVIFMCNHCPFVIHLKEAFNTFAKDYQSKGVQVIAINSNDMENYPSDNADAMTVDIEKFGYVFPYLIDEDQSVAKAYRAVCTPDLYLFDDGLKLQYRGRFDDTKPNGVPPTGKSLREATDALLNNQVLSSEQIPSMGCSIKWTAENAPDYSG